MESLTAGALQADNQIGFEDLVDVTYLQKTAEELCKKDRLSLDDLFTLWDIEERGVPLPISQEAIGQMLEIKVDDYRYRKDVLEAQAEIFKKYSDEMKAKSKSCSNKADRLKAYLTQRMLDRKLDEMEGKTCTARLTKSTATKVDIARPTQELAETYPAAVKVEYSWSLTNLKALLDSGLELPWAHIEERNSVRFYPVKQAKK